MRLILFIALVAYAMSADAETLIQNLTTNYEPSMNKTLCLDYDDRTQIRDIKLARFRRSKFSRVSCTGFMISSKCMLTAGHCVDNTKVIEFDVPRNDRGKVQSSEDVDTYEVEETIGFQNAGFGRDWGVLLMKPNKITQVYPGDRYGYFRLSQSEITPGDLIQIKGFGSSRDRNKDSTLKFSEGYLTDLNITRSIIYHQASSTGGDSGSPIFDAQNGDVVGIHTHGGCRFDSSQGTQGTNHGTYVSSQSKLVSAINRCLNR